MTNPAPWTPPSTAIVAAGATPGGPSGLADFANWDEPTWNSFLNAKFAAWLEKYNVPFEYLNTLASSIVLAFQGDPGPLEDLIEDAVREIPIVGDILADLWDAIRGQYEGDHPILLAIQGLFAPIRRVVQIFTGRPGGLGAAASEVDDFWGDMQKTLRGEATTGSWFEDVSIAAASGVEQLAENIHAAVQGGVSAGVGAIAAAGQAIADLLGIADNAEKIAMAAQQQLQDITNETNTPGWSGYSWSTIFSGADGTPLPSTDWATTRITIVGDDGHAGLLHNSSDGSHLAVTQPIHQFASDSQSASIVLGNKISFSEDRWTSIRLRCNASGTEGAVCWIRPGSIRIGRVSGGTSTVWTTISPSTKSGDIVRFRCHGDNYYVLVNGVTVLSWTDSGASVSKGAGFRHAAFSQEYLNGAFVDQASFRVASWAMADWVPAGGVVTVPAWRLRRGLNTEVELSVAHGAEALMPNDFYTIADLSSQVTVDLTLGEVTIVESGWYKIKATSKNRDNSSIVAGDDAYDVRNAYRASPWQLYVDGGPMEGPFSPGVPTEIYLAAGQKVRVGVSATVPVFGVNAYGGTSGTTNYSLPARSQITHVGGASPVFTGRKIS